MLVPVPLTVRLPLSSMVQALFWVLPEVPSKRQMALSVVLAARPRLLRAPRAVVAPVPPLFTGWVLMPGEKPGEKQGVWAR